MNEPTLLVVGAGLTGATVARVVADSDFMNVEVAERAPQVSGNLYDPVHECGLRVHLHGPHAFHTNDVRVQSFLSRFTRWTPYEHHVLAQVDENTRVPVPVNFSTLEALEPKHSREWILHLSAKYKCNEHVPMLRLRNSRDPIERAVGDLAYEYVFKTYTYKQWGLMPEDLSPSVTGRVPVRMGTDDRYFRDAFQCVPTDGYHEMITTMLEHRRIRVFLNERVPESALKDYDAVVFTGALDELMDFKLGALPYRSLRFEWSVLDVPSFQGAAQVNFTRSKPWTRITEFKHLTGQESERTVIAKEFSQPHVPEQTHPYYPIPRTNERNLHRMYVRMAERQYPRVRLAGRLADYKYLNMDQAVARGLSVASSIITDWRR